MALDTGVTFLSGPRRSFRIASVLAGIITLLFLIWLVLKPGGENVALWVDNVGETVAAWAASVVCLLAAYRSRSARSTWAVLASIELRLGCRPDGVVLLRPSQEHLRSRFPHGRTSAFSLRSHSHSRTAHVPDRPEKACHPGARGARRPHNRHLSALCELVDRARSSLPLAPGRPRSSRSSPSHIR